VVAGDHHACAITLEKELVCWGRDLAGETDIADGSEEGGSMRKNVTSVSLGWN